MAGPTGLRFVLHEVRQFVPPWVPLGIIGIPVFANMYGMIKFKHLSFFNNKPNENASKFGGDVGSEGH
ncbi:UNVERIFIED_CONTAM: hypothetical protein HHA_225555 [Hammondia hammondi]|eukprot:XP_008881938.1 hypothetical protein HHA_225555 [Hammondia hammondi]